MINQIQHNIRIRHCSSLCICIFISFSLHIWQMSSLVVYCSVQKFAHHRRLYSVTHTHTVPVEAACNTLVYVCMINHSRERVRKIAKERERESKGERAKLLKKNPSRMIGMAEGYIERIWTKSHIQVSECINDQTTRGVNEPRPKGKKKKIYDKKIHRI